MAALYHTLNHAMFKGELFLGAGCPALLPRVRATWRRWAACSAVCRSTAVCFLIGALAISAIPPLQRLRFRVVHLPVPVQHRRRSPTRSSWSFAVASAAVALAITGALAVTCFVKAYGVSFADAALVPRRPRPTPRSSRLRWCSAQMPPRGHLRGAGNRLLPSSRPVLGDVAAERACIGYGAMHSHLGRGALVNEIFRCRHLHARDRHRARGPHRPRVRCIAGS